MGSGAPNTTTPPASKNTLRSFFTSTLASNISPCQSNLPSRRRWEFVCRYASCLRHFFDSRGNVTPQRPPPVHRPSHLSPTSSCRGKETRDGSVPAHRVQGFLECDWLTTLQGTGSLNVIGRRRYTSEATPAPTPTSKSAGTHAAHRLSGTAGVGVGAPPSATRTKTNETSKAAPTTDSFHHRTILLAPRGTPRPIFSHPGTE